MEKWSRIARALRHIYFQEIGKGKYRCVLCGEVIETVGRGFKTLSRFYRHMVEKHPNVVHRIRKIVMLGDSVIIEEC